MSFARVFGDFPKWFHLLGQSSSPPSDRIPTSSEHNALQRVYTNQWKYVPSGVLILFAICVSSFVCILSKFFTNYTLKDSYSAVLVAQLGFLLTTFSLIVLLAAGQTFFISSRFEQLYAQIDVIEQLASKKTAWDLIGLRRYLISRLGLVSIGFLIPYIITLSSKPMTLNNLALLGCVFILRFLSLITFFHAIFSIELLNHMLQSLVRYVESRISAAMTTNTIVIKSRRRGDANPIKFEMYYFKLLHFNMWEMAQTINRLFGWVLLLFLMQFSLFIVYAVFHISVIVLDFQSVGDTLRECTEYSSFDRHSRDLIRMNTFQAWPPIS